MIGDDLDNGGAVANLGDFILADHLDDRLQPSPARGRARREILAGKYFVFT
jgi:hypothetical protein